TSSIGHTDTVDNVNGIPRAAAARGIPFTLSTVSVCPIEEVAPAIARPMWFQLYVLKDRGFMRNALER
ncbi:alpha-hydroxy-acid oxidizing protein, partial [Xanthomonas arboricola]|uniref:alpha-hydroxy-acid oxidizing protein n=1 Tax=Xanthomonas arboricola TaxID=56448 RepID=UPI0015E38986